MVMAILSSSSSTLALGMGWASGEQKQLLRGCGPNTTEAHVRGHATVCAASQKLSDGKHLSPPFLFFLCLCLR